MIGRKEIDNGYFAVVGMYQIDTYKKSDQVILDKKMQFYLNMAKASLSNIEKQYRNYIQNSDKVARRTRNKLIDAIYKAAESGEGEHIALMQEDEELVSVLDSIAYKYEEAIQKSKGLPKEVKTAMKKFCSYWYGFEKYVISL